MAEKWFLMSGNKKIQLEAGTTTLKLDEKGVPMLIGYKVRPA